MSNFLVIAGLSGAGRSSVAAALEDLGWFVIDNIPPELIPKVVELAERPGESGAKVALVLGRSAASIQGSLVDAVGDVRSVVGGMTLVFLDASDEVLLHRYEGTKRRHPVQSGSVAESIAEERLLLEQVKDLADVVIDTSELNVHQLRARVADLFPGDGEGPKLSAIVSSFGYKYGIPRDADLVLDCRFLPNPYWVPSLRDLTGTDNRVREYVLSTEDSTEYIALLRNLLSFLMPRFVAEGKSYVNIAIGCTGGKHRSVVLAEEIASILIDGGARPRITHRDIDK